MEGLAKAQYVQEHEDSGCIFRVTTASPAFMSDDASLQRNKLSPSVAKEKRDRADGRTERRLTPTQGGIFFCLRAPCHTKNNHEKCERH